MLTRVYTKVSLKLPLKNRILGLKLSPKMLRIQCRLKY